ncbi:MAG: hypothetical protein E2O39_03965 [Planctomycetota bacterium]|nr:MAG: hypothetical protein E2O39_03965 [Planctomycetota bacterium]
MKTTLLTTLGALLLSGGAYAQGSDACSTAQAIAGCGPFAFDTSLATQDGLPDPLCLVFGTSQIDNDVWFSWTAPGDGSYVADTCGQTLADTKMAVYADTGACPPAPALDCNDDTCGLQSQVSWTGIAGQSYLIRVGSFPSASGGTGTFTISGCPSGGPGTSYCTSTVNSTGVAGTMSGSGSSSISANDLSLIASNVPQIPGIGIFIAGQNSAQIPIWDGFLCIGPQGLQRINQITAPVGGVVTQLIDYTGASTGTVPLNVFAGFSFFYSYWYRDAAAGNTGANLTDGYDVVHTP